MIENPVLTAVIMVLIIVFLVFACAFVYLTTPNKFRFFDMPVAYCHRGFWDEKLPENTRKYIARLEDILETPISIVSVGPDRLQTIFRT